MPGPSPATRRLRRKNQRRRNAAASGLSAGTTPSKSPKRRPTSSVGAGLSGGADSSKVTRKERRAKRAVRRAADITSIVPAALNSAQGATLSASERTKLRRTVQSVAARDLAVSRAISNATDIGDAAATRAIRHEAPKPQPRLEAANPDNLPGLPQPKQISVVNEDGSREVMDLEQFKREIGTSSPGIKLAEDIAGGVVQSGEILSMATPGGAARGIIKEGGEALAKKGAQELAEAAAKKASKTTARLDKAIARNSKTAAERAKGAAGRQWKKRRPAVTSKAGRQVKRRGRASGLVKYGEAGLGPAALGAGIVATTAKEGVEDPIKTLKTTANTLPALATSWIGTAGKIAQGEWGELAQEQADYYTMLTGLASGDDEIKVGEDKDGNAIYRTPGEVIREDAGLVPAITAGLLATSAAGALGGRAIPHGTIKTPRRLERMRERAVGDRPSRVALDRRGRGVEGNRQDRKGVAQMSARWGDTGRGQAARDLREGKLGKRLKALAKKKVAEVRREDGTVATVTIADTLRLLGSEGVPADAAKGAQWIARVEAKMRSPKKTPDPADKTTWDVIAAVKENPQILNDPEIPEALSLIARVQEDISTRRGRLEGTEGPLAADARARQVHQARTLDIRTPEERVPPSLVAVTKVRPKRGQDAKKAIRKEAARMITRAKKREQKAKALPVGHPQRLKWEAEAKALRGRAGVLKMSVNRLKEAAGRDRLAARIEAGTQKGAENLPSPEALRAEATQLRQSYFADEKKLGDEFNAEMATARQREGINEPIFFREDDASKAQRGAGGGEGQPVSNVPPKDKMRTGSLAEQGLVREGMEPLVEGLVKQRLTLAMHGFMREWVDTFAHKDGDAPWIGTGDEFARAMRDGEIPPGYVQVSLARISSAYQLGRDAQSMGKTDSPVHAAIARAKASDKKGDKYIAVPKHAEEEWRRQQKGLNIVGTGLKTLGRFQSVLLLGLSPLWFLFQVPATTLAVVLRNPNVLTWGPAIKDMKDLWVNTDKRVRDDFESTFGASSGDVLEMRDVNVTNSPNELAKMARAHRFASQTWAGKLLNGQAGIFRGGPLIAANRKFEANMRQFGALLEIDRAIRRERRPQVHRYAQSLSDLDSKVKAQIAALQGKTAEQKLRFLEETPTFERELHKSLDDAMGNWNALTKNEKYASSVMIFYPFLRFSLRWSLYAYPKNNPLKAAVLLNLSAINAIEMEQMSGDGSDLGGMFNYAKVDIGGGTVLDTKRFGLGSNALVEALGGSRGALQTVTSPLQPAIGAAASALAGQDPYTGRDAEGSPASIFLKEMAGLPTPTRGLVADEPSPYSKLFRVILDQPINDTERALVPDFTTTAEQQAEATRASRLMDAAFGDGPYGSGGDPAARRELDAMLRKYGIPVPSSSSSSSSSTSSSSSSATAPWMSGTTSTSTPTAPWMSDGPTVTTEVAPWMVP